jgi:hypothetical protein
MIMSDTFLAEHCIRKVTRVVIGFGKESSIDVSIYQEGE